jgi:hypothetical protein
VKQILLSKSYSILGFKIRNIMYFMEIIVVIYLNLDNPS